MHIFLFPTKSLYIVGKPVHNKKPEQWQIQGRDSGVRPHPRGGGGGGGRGAYSQWLLLAIFKKFPKNQVKKWM